jgi:hypothetical protein
MTAPQSNDANAHRITRTRITLLFGACMLWLFWRCMAENRRAHWILYGALAGLGLYSHIFLALMIVAQYCFALAYVRLHLNFSKYIFNLVLAGCILSAIAAPLLYFFLSTSGEAANTAWLKPVGVSSTWSFLKNILKTNHSWGMVPRALSVLLLVYSLHSRSTVQAGGIGRAVPDSNNRPAGQLPCGKV